MTRKSIKVNHQLTVEDLKEAVDTHLMYKEFYNRDMETLNFEVDESGKLVGASIDIWL